MVAGVVSAMTNNNLGISGISGGWFSSYSGSQIMSVAMASIFEVNTEYTDDAIIYAAVNGAKILNMSWFIDQPISSINAALDYAYNSKGCLLVAAAGNDYFDNYIKYLANYYNVIAVSGLKKNWDHFGNTGYQIELTAPAEDIFTTYYNESTHEPTYESGNGTSGSSPMVCGASALLWSNYPSLTNFDIRRILKETAYKDFSTYNELYFGEGLLKIDAAFSYLLNMPDKPAGISIYAPIGGHPTISWNLVPDADYYKVYRSETYFRMFLYSIATTTDTFYTDNNVTVVHPKYAPITYYYRVTSVSNGYESPVSSEVSCGSNTIWKIADNNNNKDLRTVEIFQNYPNPFNPTTVIKYRINEDTFIQLRVYDVLGRLVKTLVSEKQSTGEHSIIFNGEDLSAGVYFYTLTVNDSYLTNKMVLIP